MSAQAILSMIAPAVPAAPQGSATGDAVAFEGLLAAASIPAEGIDEAAVAEASTSEAAEEMAAAAVASIAIAPPPTKSLLVVTEDAGVAADAGDEAPPVAANDDVTPPVPAQQAPAAAAAMTMPPPAQQPTQPPSGPAVPQKAAAPRITVDEEDKAGTDGDAPDTAVAVDSGETAPAPTEDAGDAPPRQPAAFRNDGSVVFSRLTPRVMREAEPLDAASAEAPAPAAEVRGTPSSTDAVAPAANGLVAEAKVGPGEAIASPAASIEAPQDKGGAPVEGPPAEAAPQAGSTAATREALSATLSRTAIEATVQIAAQIQRRLEGRNTRFEIALTPDDLGRVDVRLDIDAEGRLAARLAFDNPAAAADLRGRADELRRQLEQFGFQLADDAFEFAERDSGSSAFDRGQDAREGQSRAFARATRLNMDAEAVALTPRWTNSSLTPSGVDLKV